MTRAAGLLVLAALAACVRAGFEPGEPVPIPGGGLAGGPIAGGLTVFVLEADSDRPLEGAAVWLGDEARFARSDGRGRVTIAEPGLRGPLTISAGREGYSTFTVVAVDADEVTLPLEPLAQPASGEVSGTIEAWDQLPPLPSGRVRFAVASYAAGGGALREKIWQGGDNREVYAPPARPLFQLTVPPGEHTLYAGVFESDAAQEVSLTHVGVRQGVAVAAGKTLPGVAIPVVAASTQIPVARPPLPAGTSTLYAYPILELASGRLVELGHVSSQPKVSVPPLAGPFAGASVWVRIQALGDAETAHFLSFAMTRPEASVARLLDPPAALSYRASPERIAFKAVPGAAVHAVELLANRHAAPAWQLYYLSPPPAELTLPRVPEGAEVERPPVRPLVVRAAAIACCGGAVNPRSFVAREQLARPALYSVSELELP